VGGADSALHVSDPAAGAHPGAEQRRLLDWLERCAGRYQVVSTTTSPLLALVEARVFHDALFYRLNVVCVDVTM